MSPIYSPPSVRYALIFSLSDMISVFQRTKSMSSSRISRSYAYLDMRPRYIRVVSSGENSRNNMYTFFTYLLILNIFSYGVMILDKLKSIYKWWRISERMLWIFAFCGGVFGIWLGMYCPMYHKAGKREFRFWIPLIALFWSIGILYFIK